MGISDAPARSGPGRRSTADISAADASSSRLGGASCDHDDRVPAMRLPESINGGVLRELWRDALLVRANSRICRGGSYDNDLAAPDVHD